MTDVGDDKLVLLPESIDITGGSVITKELTAEDAEVERMVWVDAIAKESGTTRRVHLQLFLPSTVAVETAVLIIQAAGRAEGKGAQPT